MLTQMWSSTLSSCGYHAASGVGRSSSRPISTYSSSKSANRSQSTLRLPYLTCAIVNRSTDSSTCTVVTDLLRSYVIVLVGYSAGDPPVRYLLEGLHARSDAQSVRIYAFDRGSAEAVEERWRDRGVRALAYPDGDRRHSGLWDTLRAWAERADDPHNWHRRVVELAQQRPTILQSHQRGRCQTPAVSNRLASVALASGDDFPDAVQILLPLLVQVEQLDMLLHEMTEDTGQDGRRLPHKFPETLLALLDRIVPSNVPTSAYGLGSLLKSIATSAPHLQQDSRWRRLDSIVNRQ